MPLPRPTPKQMQILRKMSNVNTGCINRPWGATMYPATDEGQLQPLMLYEGEYLKWRNGRTWKDFHNLYRALLIYDLHKIGETAASIFVKYGGLAIDEVAERLGISDNMPSTIESNTALAQDLIENIRHPRRTEAEQLLIDNFKQHDTSFIGESDDCGGIYIHRISQHHNRAVHLIRLAESGKFKTFPSVLPPL